MTPRVTLGIATYNRDTYLARGDRAAAWSRTTTTSRCSSCIDGSTNPAIDEVLAGFDDPRLRVVRHERNLGIAAAYNTFVREGRGELIAMLGDDDVCLPGPAPPPGRGVRSLPRHRRRPRRRDGDRRRRGASPARGRASDFTPAALMQSFFRSHNHLVDPTRMVHRRVYEAVGGYDDALPARQRLRLLAARRAALPLPPLRRRPARRGPPPRRATPRTRRRAAREIDDVDARARGGDRAPCAARARARARLGACSTRARASARRCCASPTRSTRRLLPLPGLARPPARARALASRAAPRARGPARPAGAW